MLRLLIRLSIAAICAQAPSVLLASQPDVEELESARARSGEAVEQARRLSRDADFNDEILREADRALTAAKEAELGASLHFDGVALPDSDAETLLKARSDLEALLANPGLMNPEGSPTKGDEPAPLIFVSFSMPEDSLRALLTEAARTGSPIVLRGLVENSMQRTAAHLGELLDIKDSSKANPGSAVPSLAIDPTLFERFGVDKVPAFVLPLNSAAPCTPEGCAVPEHLKVAGDVSLDYALGVMAREASGTSLGSRAGQWRQKLEVRP